MFIIFWIVKKNNNNEKKKRVAGTIACHNLKKKKVSN